MPLDSRQDRPPREPARQPGDFAGDAEAGIARRARAYKMADGLLGDRASARFLGEAHSPVNRRHASAPQASAMPHGRVNFHDARALLYRPAH